MGCRGVIFDLDGTLADTLRDIVEAVNVGLHAMGLPPRSAEAVRQFVGDGLPLLCRRALGDDHADKADRLAALMLEHYRLHDLDHARLYDGIPELLDVLVARGVALAVLSNKPQPATTRIVNALCGKWPWTAVEGYRAEEFKKPDPRTAIEVARRMGAPPGEIILLGDSVPDVQTARAAGMRSVAATWGFRSREELAAAGPDHLIDRPGDLLPLL